MKAKPCSRSAAAADAASWSIRTPSASRTSADPARDVIARFPCLATTTPAAAATSAAVVEMLNVPLPSPPVPDDVDRARRRIDATRRARAWPSRTRPARQRSRRACAGPCNSAASWAGVASPSMTAPIAGRASSTESVPPSTIEPSAARTMLAHRVPSSIRSARPAVANVPVASSRSDASPSPACRRKFASRCGPCGVSTDSRVELDALERQARRGGCP